MRTKEEILKQMEEIMPFEMIGKGQMPYILEAMETYAQERIKNNGDLPNVSGSFSEGDARTLLIYGRKDNILIDTENHRLDVILEIMLQGIKPEVRQAFEKTLWKRLCALANYR